MGVIHTPHGDIATPAFVPVGTKATVKSLKPEDMHEHVMNQSVLANTYHLYLQPGHEVIKKAGGLHTFMHWDGPTWTDSGGFQVFSLGAAFGKGVSKFAKDASISDDVRPTVYSKELATSHGKLCIVDEEGVTFTSHIDGSMHRFTPERPIEIQHAIGADIIFAFDECTSPTADRQYQEEALARTHRWAKRSILAHKGNYEALAKQGLFGIVQGGVHDDLRKESARTLADMDFDGYGIGGCFSKDDLGESIAIVNDILPQEKPRHLLGIGEPEDLFQAVEMGCDTFDCVAPTRIARTGTIYTHEGKKDIVKSEYAEDFSPLDEDCECSVCKHYTRAYLSHLFRAHEMLGPHLASIHNLHFITTLVQNIRQSLLDDTFDTYKAEFLKRYKG